MLAACFEKSVSIRPSNFVPEKSGHNGSESMNSEFADIPCGSNCGAECAIRDKMTALQDTLVPPTEDKAAELVRAFFGSYRDLCRSSSKVRGQYTPDVALPALFDFVVSAKYAERMVSDGGWTYCAGSDLDEGPALYFPYLKTCPRCSVKRGIKPSAKANKPSSDPIGEIASDTTILIFSELIGRIASDVRFGKSTDRQGDVDFVMYDQEMVALAEIKSSPLLVYPLEIELARSMTEVRDGESVSKRDHSPATADIDKSEIAFYASHIDLRIPLGRIGENDWPYPSLIRFVSEPRNAGILISAWKELYDVYATAHRGRGGRRKDVDNRKWLMCGCGSTVDDSKNAPGMDRTDDVKKGTYQVLKFGTYYKEKCPRRILRAVLVSNFMPLHKFDRYLSEMQNVLWTKEKYSVALGKDIVSDDVVAFRSDSVFNLYDALLCLTRSIYRDEHLREISNLDRFVEVFCP